MSFGVYNFASARHVPDMSRHLAIFLAKTSVRRSICQWPGGGTDVDMSADADMSSISLMG